jgi:vacuolar-type H+-ATPase subunit C/Vma6
VQELLAKCHPLGMFDAIATLAVASNMRELYRLVLVSLHRRQPWNWYSFEITVAAW